MRTPPFLMAATLLFWGWQNGMLLWSALMAAVLETSRWSRPRWEFSNADLNRISDLCSALFIGAIFLLYSTGDDRNLLIFQVAGWMPFCFFPLMLAQAWGNRPQIPLSVFWWLLRRTPHSPNARKSFNVSYIYFAICVLAASASPRGATSTASLAFFYPCVALLLALALSSARPRRLPLAHWISLLLVVSIAGQFGYKGLQQMQSRVESLLGSWIAGMFGNSPDTREHATNIGRNTRLPQSGKIAVRMTPAPGGLVPALLREEVWDTYRRASWLASNTEFRPVTMSASGDSAHFSRGGSVVGAAEISRYYNNGAGLLLLPQGTFELDGLVAGDIRTNRLGVAIIDGGPGLLTTRATYAAENALDSMPNSRDLGVPAEEKPVLDQVLARLKTQRMTERQKIRAVRDFFTRNFIYTLNLPGRPPPPATPLSFFLTNSQRGHCEYYATATVLLLREAGVNARYATGYAVLDSARHGDTYFIRDRHAHAWVLAYHSDTRRWEQVDTTPGTWIDNADTNPPWWEPASDWMSNLFFDFSKWRWGRTSYAQYSLWLLIPLILYLAGRIIFDQRRRKGARASDTAAAMSWPGADSELFLIDSKLAGTAFARAPNESLRSWQERLEATAPDASRLRRIFHLHRSLRFDPQGLPRAEREQLRQEAQAWLAGFAAAQEKARAAA